MIVRQWASAEAQLMKRGFFHFFKIWVRVGRVGGSAVVLWTGGRLDFEFLKNRERQNKEREREREIDRDRSALCWICSKSRQLPGPGESSFLST
jgi:hypothetical protein